MRGKSYGPKAPKSQIRELEVQIPKLFPKLSIARKAAPERPGILELHDVDPMFGNPQDAVSDPFLKKYVRSFTQGRNPSNMMIDIRSPEIVTVYRGIAWGSDGSFDWEGRRFFLLDNFEPNANYQKTPTKGSGGFGLDCVADCIQEARRYVRANGVPGFLLRYDLPALLLAYDQTTKRSEPSYVIDPRKLRRYGVFTVVPFLTGIARYDPSNGNEIWVTKRVLDKWKNTRQPCWKVIKKLAN